MNIALAPGAMYRLTANLCRYIRRSKSRIDRAIVICAYASICGEISERNLIAISKYAGVNMGKPPARDLLAYYTKNGIFSIRDNGLGLAAIIENDGRYERVDEKTINETKVITDEIRREFISEGNDE